MTTEYPSGTPAGPGGRRGFGRGADDAWGCFWWWWVVVIIIIILIIWWAGWGWGTSGGYWFRGRPNTVAPGTNAPTYVPPANTPRSIPAPSPGTNAPPATRPSP